MLCNSSILSLFEFDLAVLASWRLVFCYADSSLYITRKHPGTWRFAACVFWLVSRKVIGG